MNRMKPPKLIHLLASFKFSDSVSPVNSRPSLPMFSFGISSHARRYQAVEEHLMDCKLANAEEEVTRNFFEEWTRVQRKSMPYTWLLMRLFETQLQKFSASMEAVKRDIVSLRPCLPKQETCACLVNLMCVRNRCNTRKRAFKATTQTKRLTSRCRKNATKKKRRPHHPRHPEQVSGLHSAMNGAFWGLLELKQALQVPQTLQKRYTWAISAWRICCRLTCANRFCTSWHVSRYVVSILHVFVLGSNLILVVTGVHSTSRAGVCALAERAAQGLHPSDHAVR